MPLPIDLVAGINVNGELKSDIFKGADILTDTDRSSPAIATKDHFILKTAKIS